MKYIVQPMANTSEAEETLNRHRKYKKKKKRRLTMKDNE
jgi:hypothetical protein